MDTAALLSALRDRDVRLWTEEGRLRCSAPVGTLDAAMRATLASRKEELLALLRRAEMLKSLSPAIVPIKPEGGRPPVFAVSGHGGDVFWLRALARRLAPEQPVFGVQPPGLDGTKPLKSVEALARYEIEQIRRYRASGPYLIAGHCAGGIIAFEVAQQLTASGQQVALLALIGSPFPTSFHRAPQILLRLGNHVKALISGSLAERRRYITSKVFRRLRPPEVLAGVSPATLAAGRRVERATLAAVRRYRPRLYAGQVDLFVTADKWHRSQQWRDVAGSVREHKLEGFEINDLLLGPHVEVLAAALQDRLDARGHIGELPPAGGLDLEAPKS
jgi:thioesterase domain-containing protein